MKGRLHENALTLLDAAGFQLETRDERALSIRCHSAPVDVLLVRAADVPEYVQDGAVDCGITGADLVGERDADVIQLQRLGFGYCTLEAAVLEDDAAQSLQDLAGRRVATVFPHLARTTLARLGISVELCEVTGSVEIAPRLGLSDAIVDLVSSGGTLRTNGLRSLGGLFESEAVLIASSESRERVAGLEAALASVVQARNTRYLMFNAPRTSIPRIREVLPTDGSPSVVPLLRSDAVAIHALVPADSVWELLPQLQGLGATSILLTSVEMLLP